MFDPVGELGEHYRRVVQSMFDGRIPRDYRIVFNPLLRRLTGRITYSQRLIEISRYHYSYSMYGMADAIATLEHELLHLYLHVLGRPSGHSNELKRLAKQKGSLVSRVRRVREVHGLACGICCRAHAQGSWDERYTLRFVHRVRMV